MKIQHVILKALSGEISWLRAADIVGITARSMRRWRQRYEASGYDGLLDRRTGRPSPKRAPLAEVKRILRLYREKYRGFNVRHFCEIGAREEGIGLSYSFVKKALQEAGLVAKRKRRGPHRKRRERRACFGEMLHLDGSPHGWLLLAPEERQTLITVQDDATGRVLYAQLEDGETTAAVMKAMREVVGRYGIPLAWYTDRAGWAFYTPKANEAVDKDKLTQVGRALAILGVEHIPAYSPQARGRNERLNGTLQDRLVNELRLHGCRSSRAANQYLRERFIEAYSERFAVPPRDRQNLFVSAKALDLDQVFCVEEARVVGKDNTVTMQQTVLQIEKQPGRSTCAGLRVLARRHLDQSFSVWLGSRCLGRFDPDGRILLQPAALGRNRAPGYALRPVAALPLCFSQPQSGSH